MAFPTSDVALVPYSTNWNTRIGVSPVTYGLSAAQATQYSDLHDPYFDAVLAVQAARESGVESRPLASIKQAAKTALLKYGRELYAFVQANTAVTDAAKIELGVVVRDVQPTPIPAPEFAPALEVVSVNGRIVEIRLSDPQNPTRRRLPEGVNGAIVMSHVGATAPAEPSAYSMNGPVSKTSFPITFGNEVAPGSKVWLTAVWFNGRKQMGPACDPVSTYLSASSMSMAA